MIKTSSLFLYAAAAAALVACGDDGSTSTGSGSGGGGGSTSGNGGNDAVASSSANSISAASSGSSSVVASSGSPASTGAGPVTASTGAGPVTVSSGAGGDGGGGGEPIECELSDFMENFFTDPEANECVQASCCDELAACDPDVDPTACFNENDGTFDTSLPAAGRLNDCATNAGCFGAVICDSGIGFGEDPDQETIEYAQCLSENCCEEFNFCTDGGFDADSCISCLNGQEDTFDLCEPANTCAIENCEQGLVFVPICDSGLGTSDIESGQCADANCCDAYTACTGGDPDDEEAIEACLECLDAGEGPLCDAAIACEAEFCSTAVCDSGIAFSDIEAAACLTESCCAEYTACSGGDPDDEVAIQACLDCFIAEGGQLCDAAIACTDTFCGGEGGGGTGSGGAGGGG